MAAMVDLANPAAAVAAGWAKVQSDRGATFKGGAQYLTMFEKWLTGEPGCGGWNMRTYGESSASAAAADTAALAQLNSRRTFRYGKGTNQNAGGLPANSGFQHIPDIT
jgi:hypothetical protein